MISFTFGKGQLLGYESGWELKQPRNFFDPAENLSTRQRVLEDQLKAGVAVHRCLTCKKLYKTRHTCRQKPVTTDELAGNEDSANDGLVLNIRLDDSSDEDDERASEHESDSESSSGVESECEETLLMREDAKLDVIAQTRLKRGPSVIEKPSTRCTCRFEFKIGDVVYAEFDSASDKKFAVSIWEGTIEDIFVHDAECSLGIQYLIYFVEDDSWWVMSSLEFWPVSCGLNFKHCRVAPSTTNSRRGRCNRKCSF